MSPDGATAGRTRQVVWAAALSGGSVFISMAAALVVLKLATQSLSVHDFGVFVLLQVMADALNIVFNLGLAVSLPKLIAAAPAGERRSIAGAAMAGVLCLATLVAAALLALWCAARAAAPSLGPDATRLLHFAWLVPPLFLVGTLRDTAMAALAGLHRFGQRALGIVVASLLYTAIAAAAVALGHVSVVTFTGAMALGHALNLLWLYRALPPGARFRLDPPRFLAATRESAALYQNNLLTFVHQRLDALIAQHFLGLVGASMLGAAKQLPTILSRAVGALLVPLLPSLAGLVAAGDLTLAASVLNRALVLVAVLGYTATLACAALAGPLLWLLTSSAYLPAAPLVGWLMAAMSVAIQGGILGQGLIALDRAAAVTRANIALAVISIALNALFLPRLGVAGAAYAALAAVLASAILQGIQLHHAGLRIQLRGFLGTQVIFAACWAVTLLFPGALPGLAAALAFPVLCIATRALPAAEISGLLGALARH